MSRGQSGARRPATKFAQLQKKLGRQAIQKNLQSQKRAEKSQQSSLSPFGKAAAGSRTTKLTPPPKES